MTTAIPATLTPSEVVLIHGERFSKSEKDGYKLPGGTDVDSGELAYAAARAAILANEERGAFAVGAGTEKRFFGLFTAKVLRLRPGATQPAWPADTLEARIQEIAARPKTPEGVTLDGVFQGLFPSTVYTPWTDLLEWVEQGLVARGLAEPTTEIRKTLGIFKHEKHSIVLNEAGRSVAALHPVTAVQQLFSAMETARGELWGRFEKGVKAALDAREDTRDPSGSSFD